MSEVAPIDAALKSSRQVNPRRAPMRQTRQVKIPLDHQPDAVQGKGPSANTARIAMGALRTAWQQIQAAAADDEVSLPRLAVAAQRATEHALAGVDRATRDIGGRIASLGQAIDQKTMPRVDPALATEIRQYWRGKKNLNELSQAVARSAETSSAILGAPGYLSGLDDDQRQVVHQRAVAAHAKEEQDALAEANAALNRIADAGTRMTEIVGPKIREWSQPENAALTALEKGTGDGGS